MIPISIEREVAERLEKLGYMHDTYNAVIKRLLDSNGRRPDNEDKPRGGD